MTSFLDRFAVTSVGKSELVGIGKSVLRFLGSPCHRPQNLDADAERLIAIRSPAAMSGVTVQIGTSRKQTLARGESSAPCAPRACEKSRPIFKENGGVDLGTRETHPPLYLAHFRDSFDHRYPHRSTHQLASTQHISPHLRLSFNDVQG